MNLVFYFLRYESKDPMYSKKRFYKSTEIDLCLIGSKKRTIQLFDFDLVTNGKIFVRTKAIWTLTSNLVIPIQFHSFPPLPNPSILIHAHLFPCPSIPI